MASTDRNSLLLDLENAMNAHEAHERTAVLERITDLFLCAASDVRLIELFDDVFLKLIEQVETSARAKLAQRLADINTAPNRIIQSLAQDQVFDVAEPVLARSTQVADETLVRVANTRSQAHLLTIAGRSPVNPPVSDALVSRGNVIVLRRLSANRNAQFSQKGLEGLAAQGATDGEIAENLASRSDIPRWIYRRLLAQATDAVRARLLNGAPSEEYQIIFQAMDEVGREFNQALRADASEEVRQRIYDAHKRNKLNEGVLAEFARKNMFAETAVSLAILTSTPVEIVEDQMIRGQMSGLLVLCRSKNYQWPTAKAIICIGHERSISDLELARHEYYTLSVQSATRALRFVGARRAIMSSTAEDDAKAIKPALKVV